MEILNTLVRLKPGMYILRHPKGGLAPLSIGVAPSTPATGRMERLATSGTQGSLLRDGSDCIVVLVTGAPVDIVVTAFLERKGDAVPQLRVDQIGLDPAPADAAGAPGVPVPASSNTGPANKPALQVPARGVSLIGHIERRGDTIALPGKTLGDAASDLRVEGFQVVWPDRPDGVDLAYGIAVEGEGPLPVVRTGKFCGTRGEARRIVEVTFALIGPDAEMFDLQGQACFTGGFVVPVRPGVPLSGPSGVEHLTSLSLEVVPHSAGQRANPWHDAERTRTFKAPRAAPDVLGQDNGGDAAAA